VKLPMLAETRDRPPPAFCDALVRYVAAGLDGRPCELPSSAACEAHCGDV
jgi:hypothetical protein